MIVLMHAIFHRVRIMILLFFISQLSNPGSIVPQNYERGGNCSHFFIHSTDCAKKICYQFSPDRGNCVILGQSQARDFLTARCADQVARRGDRGKSQVAWRIEQSDAVMGSGPATYLGCPGRRQTGVQGLQKARDAPRYAQTTILSRRAAGHPAAFRRHRSLPDVDCVTESRLARRLKRRWHTPGWSTPPSVMRSPSQIGRPWPGASASSLTNVP